MKKLITNLILVAVFMLFPVSVFASGNISASPSSLSIEVGSSKTFTITATNTIGDVSISSSNTGVAKVSTGEWGTGMVDEGQTKSGTITVTGVSEGTATITLTLDAATFDGEDLAGQKRTVTVTVVAKPTQPSNNNNNNNNNNNSNNNTNNNTNNTANNKSANNKIKELTVDGHELKKVDDHNYTLSVGNDVNSINIKATAEDSKAKITGTGSHELNIGENNIEIIVTAENGSQNKISIKVTRKDAYYLEDLDSVLNSSTTNDIIINSDSKLSSQDLSKIKNSGKTIKFNYNDENKKTLYSWLVDGSKINAFDELITGVDFNSSNSKEIAKLSNYADGIYISMKHKGTLPTGTKIKLYVGDKYFDDDIVNAYYYDSNNNKLENVKEGLTVKDGYIEFEVEKGSDYFITMSTISNVESAVEKSNSSFIIIIVVIIVLATAGIGLYLLLKKKNKNNNNNNNNNNYNNENNNNTNNNSFNTYN